MIAFVMKSVIAASCSAAGVRHVGPDPLPAAAFSPATRSASASSAGSPSLTEFSISCSATTSASSALIAETIFDFWMANCSAVAAPRASGFCDVSVVK